MKGIQVTRFGAAEVLEYRKLPDLVPGNGEVLIEVSGASVNFADIKARLGDYHLGKTPPFTPGLDCAGMVLDVGRDVSGIKRGDHVIAFPKSGGYAEQAVADQDLTFVLPQSTDLVQAAAAALVAGTVTHMLTRLTSIGKNESILVHTAAGGVGSTAVHIAAAFGVEKIYGSIGSPWKEKHVRNMGAIGVVDYNSSTYSQEINDMTEGKGVDVILNPLGGRTIEEDLKCLAPFGRLIVFGELRGEPATIPQDGLYTKNRSILGSSFGHYRSNRPESVRQSMATVIDLLTTDKLDLSIDTLMRLEQAAQAQKRLEDRMACGKIVLLPNHHSR